MSDTAGGNWSNDEVDSSEPHPGHGQTSIDETFECLSHRHRRLVLQVLREEDVTTEDAISARSGVPQNQAKLELRHRHLPKLRRAGYIQWNEQTGYLSRGPSFADIDQYLQLLADNAEALPHDWP